ncbi:F-box only protein 15-like isoform X2 [Nelusetta ayraudi]|uniref:F-box only protein 15-like isoform X2 n=1 Tax=Nelusetta ayraudi TaxID=303726 RepID=UPI003F6E6A34
MPGPCSGPGSGSEHPGGRSFQRPLNAAASRTDPGGPQSLTETSETHCTRTDTGTTQITCLDMLPPEVLLKILSHLDPHSLICISHVNKLFHQLANDDVVWHRIYMSEFGTSKARWSVSTVEERPLQGHWRKRYLWQVAGQEVDTWREELRHTNPSTGLPWETRQLGVSWELTVSQSWGSRQTQPHSHAHYYESTVVVCWSGPFPHYQHIHSLQLHASHRGAPRSTALRKTSWRSMLLKLDMKTGTARHLGKDRLISLVHVAPSFIIGIWRGHSQVAFVMACLHQHLLVERSLLGSPASPYSEPPAPPQATRWDLELSLRGFTLRLLLHGSDGAEVTTLHFHRLLARPGGAQLVELQAVQRWDQSQHQLLTGAVQLAWRAEPLEGAVQNCCFLALTLLDGWRRPCWCVATPACLRPVAAWRHHRWPDYGGEPVAVEHSDGGGRVELQLVRLPEDGHFLLVALTLHVPLDTLRPHLGDQHR